MTARRVLSALLAGLAGLLAVAAVTCWSLDRGVVDQDGFADRAVAALHHDAVQRAVGTEIARQVEQQVPAGAVSPAQLRALVDRMVAGPSFERVYRKGAMDLNRALLHNDGSDARLTVDLAEVLRPTSPQLAAAVGDRSVTVLSVRAGDRLQRTSRAADVVRTLALVLPFFALAAFVGSLVLAPRAGRAVAAAGAGAAVGGVLLLTALFVGRSRVDEGIDFFGARAVESRDAAVQVWDAYAGDLQTIALVAMAAGVLIALAGLLSGVRGRSRDRVSS